MENSTITNHMYCSQCGVPVKEIDKFCAKCGNKLKVDNVEKKSIPIEVNSEIVCDNCGLLVPADKSYCIECGAVLKFHGNQREIQNTFQKPKSVILAVILLWASLGLGLLKLLIDNSNLSSMASTAFNNFILFFTFVLMVILIISISEGKNWARITFLIFYVIGLLPLYPVILSELSRSPVVGILSLSQSGLQLITLFLIYTNPGSIWFRKVQATTLAND